MTLSAVTARYAHALADVVTAAGSPLNAQQTVAELQAFAAPLAASADLHNSLVTPAVPPGRKKAVVSRIADVIGLSRITRNFLFVLVDHRRISLLPEIIHTFERVVEERLGFARAEVQSAEDLTERQRADLGARLEQLTGKRIRARFAVDPSLIGGVVARIGSTVYDGSVRGQLASLGRRLSAEG